MTTTVTLSERNREQFRRFVRLNYDSCIKRGLGLDKERLLDLATETLNEGRFGKFELEWEIAMVTDCAEIQECDHEGECEFKREFTLCVRYKGDKAVHLSHYDFRMEDSKTNMESKILEWVDELPSTYEICRCKGCLALKEGWCHACYLYRYKRTEEEGGDCCVCLENEGRWIKLSCKHIIHASCYGSLRDQKCPLCRQAIKNDYRYDPYD